MIVKHVPHVAAGCRETAHLSLQPHPILAKRSLLWGVDSKHTVFPRTWRSRGARLGLRLLPQVVQSHGFKTSLPSRALSPEKISLASVTQDLNLELPWAGMATTCIVDI